MSFPVQHAVNAKSFASCAVSRHELEALTVCVRGCVGVRARVSRG
jgi:hypothetical protein